MTTTTTNAEGVTTVTIGDESNGVEITIIPADDNEAGVVFEIEGYGTAAIDSGVRLNRDQAADLAARLFELLT